MIEHAKPRLGVSLNDCDFYHTMDLPGHGVCEGCWDLRGKTEEYLGFVDVRGKHVLDVGSASGFLCFEMERRGADVVAFDLAKDSTLDWIVPVGMDVSGSQSQMQEQIHRMQNSWWLAHKCYQSRCNAIYGNVYEFPKDLGKFDLITVGNILLHLRDPFKALQNIVPHCTERIVVTESIYKGILLTERLRRLLGRLRPSSGSAKPCVYFMPDSERREPQATWWILPPDYVAQMLRLLGFETESVTYHTQLYKGKKIGQYTLVACPK